MNTEGYKKIIESRFGFKTGDDSYCVLPFHILAAILYEYAEKNNSQDLDEIMRFIETNEENYYFTFKKWLKADASIYDVATSYAACKDYYKEIYNFDFDETLGIKVKPSCSLSNIDYHSCFATGERNCTMPMFAFLITMIKSKNQIVADCFDSILQRLYNNKVTSTVRNLVWAIRVASNGIKEMLNVDSFKCFKFYDDVALPFEKKERIFQLSLVMIYLRKNNYQLWKHCSAMFASVDSVDNQFMKLIDDLYYDNIEYGLFSTVELAFKRLTSSNPIKELEETKCCTKISATDVYRYGGERALFRAILHISLYLSKMTLEDEECINICDEFQTLAKMTVLFSATKEMYEKLMIAAEEIDKYQFPFTISTSQLIDEILEERESDRKIIEELEINKYLDAEKKKELKESGMLPKMYFDSTQPTSYLFTIVKQIQTKRRCPAPIPPMTKTIDPVILEKCDGSINKCKKVLRAIAFKRKKYGK